MKEKNKDEKQRPVKKTVTTVTEETHAADPVLESTPAVEETDDTRNAAAYPAIFRSWLKTINAGDRDFTATLFKYDDKIKQKQHIVCENINEMLTLDDVGLSYGSGEYRYVITFPGDDLNNSCKAVRFNLHKSYDERRIREGIIQAPGSNGSAKTGLADSLELLRSLTEIMKNMMPPAAPPNPDMSVMMAKQYDFMQNMMQKSFRDTSDLYKQLMLREIPNPEETDENEPGTIQEKRGPGMMETLIPLFEKYIPVLLGNNPAAQMTADAIKSLPEFQNVLKDNQKLSKIVDAVKAEIGPAKTKKILEKLGVTTS